MTAVLARKVAMDFSHEVTGGIGHLFCRAICCSMSGRYWVWDALLVACGNQMLNLVGLTSRPCHKIETSLSLNPSRCGSCHTYPRCLG